MLLHTIILLSIFIILAIVIFLTIEDKGVASIIVSILFILFMMKFVKYYLRKLKKKTNGPSISENKA